MSIASRQVNVGPNKVLLADLTSTSGGAQVVLLNSDATFTTFVGGSDVSSTTGYTLKAGASLSLTLASPDMVYAISGGTTNTIIVNVFRAGS